MRTLRTLAPAGLLAAIAYGQIPLNTEIIVNGGFEDISLAGWTSYIGSVTPAAYSGGSLPTPAVSQAINGGTHLLKGLTWNSAGHASVRQVFDLSGNAAAVDRGDLAVDVSAYLGGYANQGDYGRIHVLIFDSPNPGTGVELVSVPFEVVSLERNFETTMLYKYRRIDVPVRARRLEIHAVSWVQTGPSMEGTVDNVSAKLVMRANQPPAAPVGAELLIDRTFEGTAIVNPAQRFGWRVESGNGQTFRTVAYGTSGAPSTEIGQSISGGSRSLQAVSWPGSGWSYLMQMRDVRGNAADIAARVLWIQIGAHVGGITSDGDYCHFAAVFYDQEGTEISRLETGDSQVLARNAETTMIPRTVVGQVPENTAWIGFRAAFRVIDGPAPVVAFLDNPTAALRRGAPATPPVAYDSNLITDPGFETQRVISSTSVSGWRNAGDGYFALANYGDANVPASDIGQAINGGSKLLRATTWNSAWSYLSQSFDLRGNVGDIRNGVFGRASAYLGGRLSDPDYCLLRIVARDSSGATVLTVDSWTSEPYTRNSETTMQRREVRFALPMTTESLECYLAFRVINGPDPLEAFADNVDLRLARTPFVAPALPLDAELLDNPAMEGARINSPVNAYGGSWWNRDNEPACRLVPYGTPGYPGADVAAAIGGGSSFVVATNWGGGGFNHLVKSFDASSNSVVIDQGLLSIRLAGHFGGIGTEADSARLGVRYYDSKGQLLRVDRTPEVTAADRGNRTILLRRDRTFPIPPQTRKFDVELETWYGNTGGMDGLADNLSAKLVLTNRCGATQCLSISSSDPARALLVAGDLPTQIAALNAAPPAFNPNTWSQVYRKNENDNPRLNRSFLCTNPNIIPLNEAFVAATSYFQGSDEVTLDNCGSAFYRFTFDLPAGFTNVTLFGKANADDMAVVWLNGHQISGTITASALGQDLQDSSGRRILTWPTQDAFFTNTVTNFHAGTNELVFAVCGDASQFEPTGVEFEAKVLVDSLARLTVDATTHSLAAGGFRSFTLDADPGNGGRPYLLLGSWSGQYPGTQQNGYTIPLNRDLYYDLLLANAMPFMVGGVGFLSTSGQAFARLSPPPLPILIGYELTHAAIVGDFLSSNFLISNPVLLTLRP